MFGFSLPKLIVLALIISAVWYGYKWFEKNQGRAARRDRSARRGGAKNQDLAACDACGTYVSPEIETCPQGRDDCPSIARPGGSR